jgi:hypothetical protein
VPRRTAGVEARNQAGDFRFSGLNAAICLLSFQFFDFDFRSKIFDSLDFEFSTAF